MAGGLRFQHRGKEDMAYNGGNSTAERCLTCFQNLDFYGVRSIVRSRFGVYSIVDRFRLFVVKCCQI